MDYQPGQQVEWLHEARGGYGYRWWVAAVVVKVTAKRITIDAELQNGGVKRVSVTPERLRPRPNNGANGNGQTQG